MPMRQKLLLVVLSLFLIAGCSEEEGSKATQGTGPTQATGGLAVGKVTMADGSPLRGEVQDIGISIGGVSEAAENVSYSPAVKPDGTYKQKLAPGQYRFSPARLTLMYDGQQYQFPLEPVGSAWNKDRDAAEGIAQDFVWKPNGPTPYGQSEKLDNGNHTHWYGMSVSIRADGWRNDISAAPAPVPDGTKLTFNFKPTGKAIDGTDPQPVTAERTSTANYSGPLDIPDLLPAPYEVTGTATLPDGTTKPLLWQGKGDYPGYKPMVSIKVEKDNILGKLWSPPLTFVIE